MKESHRLHMTFGIYNSDGWSMSGGPWITPEESMKEIVWRDTLVEGGKTIKTKLPKPEANLIYKDIAVLAFPALQSDALIAINNIVSSNLVTNADAVITGNKSIKFLKAKDGQAANIVIDFGEQKDVRRVVFDDVKNNPFLEASAKLEYSNDQKTFIKVQDSFPLNLKAEGLIRQLTFSFKKVNARYMRLSVELEPSTKKPVPMEQESIEFGKLAFYTSPRVHLWEPKSGESKRIRHERQQVFMKELNSPVNENLPESFLVNTNNIINLSNQVDGNGMLDWKAPKGNWIIQRVGYTSTNRMVNPATKEGRGLECNKMDAKAVEKHFNSYAAKFIDLSKKLIGKPIDQMQMESWEAGIQNWTDGFENEFSKRNGYSIMQYLPVLAGGYVVNSYEESEKFLWDFRKVVSQLIAENYWGTMYRLAKAKGVTVSGEGSGMQHYLYDPMLYQKYLDIPMGEFWPNEGHVRADVKNASSVAHTYGHNLAGTESFTSGDENLWSVTPFKLKQIGDEAYTLGVNQFVLHTYVHQPYDVAPGFTLKHFGNHLQRLNPWYTHAQGWFDYMARCQYMLREGKNIQDIAYFTGEGIPAYLGLPWELHPKLPNGYDYDGVNTDIIKQMIVKNGKLILPTGATYSLLVFQNITLMTPELAKEVKRLVNIGATIISAKPVGSPSLSNNALADRMVKEIADEVWASVDGKQITEHSYGKGKVYSGITVDEVLKKLNVIPDFTYTSTNENAKVNFVHKKAEENDTYFLANYNNEALNIKGAFRVRNKVPQLWDADKGIAVVLPFQKLNDEQIEVQLKFDPLGSMFIVFTNSTDRNIQKVGVVKEAKTSSVTGPWNVSFMSAKDTFKTSIDTLLDWSKSKNERIKYFSGTASYSNDLLITETKSKIELDLGEANNNMVTVNINGKTVAHLWKPPYTVDITPFVEKGKNHVEIFVTNTAVNSLIGDEQFPSDLSYDKTSNISSVPSWLSNPQLRQSQRKTFVTYKYLNRTSKLDPSGLVGPLEVKYYNITY